MTLTTFEEQCLARFRSGAGVPAPGAETDGNVWLHFALSTVLAAGGKVRGAHLSDQEGEVMIKADGSPVTRLEQDIEALVGEQLHLHGLEAALVGEERGGALPEGGRAVAVDPVDGTWSLVNRTTTHVTSLALFERGKTVAGVVLNPTTGEVCYCEAGCTSRLLQLATFDEPDAACDLPLAGGAPDAILLNIHPGRSAGPVIDAFYKKWSRGRVQMVRSVGGAPAWGLVESAKSRFIYLNLWPGRPAEPFDLAAGTMIVRGAGGDVVGLDGEPIDPLGHRGPFVAGMDRDVLAYVVRVAGETIS